MRAAGRLAARRGGPIATTVAAILAAVLATVLAAVLAVAATGGTALAADGHVVQIRADGGRLHVVFSATGLATGDVIDPATVRVSVDGRQVPSNAASAGTATAAIRRTAVLAIDTSGSMRGAKLDGATSAALAFLDAVPADVAVGLVGFADTPSVLVRPTTDRAALRAAVSALRARGRTALYDGIATAARAAGRDGARTIVVLSDGGDTASKLDLDHTVALLRRSRPIVDAVGFDTTAAESRTLSRLSRVVGGRVISATGASGLADAFRQAAHDVAVDVVVTADVPGELTDRQATVAVTATAGSATLRDSASIFIPPVPGSRQAPHYGARPAVAPVGFAYDRTGLYAALGGIFVGLTALVGLAMTTVRRDRALHRMRRRLSVYTLTGRPPRRGRERTVLGDSAVAHSAVEWAGRVVAKRSMDARLATKLEGAGVPMRPAEWLLVHLGVAVGAGLLMLLVSGGRAGLTVVGLLAGLAGPWPYLGIKRSRRRAAFLAHLPDTLQLMAGSLVAGYSITQAVDAVVGEGTEPVAGEFNRVLVESRLGVPLETALDGVADRMDSRDFRWVVMAIRIQREVGGNLAELLTTVAGTLRERDRLRRQVRVLSAEGRLSAYILFGLPVLFGTYLFLVRPDYLRLLYTDRIGWAMLLVLAVTLTAGGLWLRKVVRVEV